MYQERGLLPSDRLAGLMAAAIVADTVMFKSPTATQRDHRMAERMARIANISLDELGQAIFSASMDNKPTESRFFSAISRISTSRTTTLASARSPASTPSA